MRRAIPLTILAIVVVALAGCAPEPTTAVSTPSAPAASAEPTPQATASAAGIVTVPATCTELVPADQLAALDHLELNSAAEQTAGLPSGLADQALADLAAQRRVLTCVWENPASESTYLRTTVSRVTGGDGAHIMKALTDAQVQCYYADSGVRCEYSGTHESPAVEYGETHFVRDDIWIATAWSNVAPPGYTSALVGVLWP